MLRRVPENKILKLEYRGAPQTVGVIRHAALESQKFYPVRILAESVCQNIRSKDYLSEILALYHYVCANTRYMRDPRTVELVQAPYLVVEQLSKGMTPNLDCDDMSALLAALFLAVGCQTRVVTVAFQNMFHNGDRQYSHVFAQAKEPRSGAWITCDPVAAENTDSMLRRTVAAKFWPIA